MRIGRVEYQQFMSFEHAEVDFSLPGLTGIEGFAALHAAGDNGSGKSALFDGVSWALFGRGIRKDLKGDSVVRHAAGRDTVVDVTVNTEPEIRVVRHRRHKKNGNRVDLYVGGTKRTRGTSPETDVAIIAALGGLTFTSFCSSVAFGAREDVAGFFTSTDTQRKAVMENLLGLEVFADAERVAKRRLKAGTVALDRHKHRRSSIESRIQQVEARIDQMHRTADPTSAVFRALGKHLYACSCRREANKARKTHARFQSRLTAAQKTYEDAMQVYTAKVSSRAAVLQEKAAKVRELSQEIHDLRRDARATEITINNLLNGKGGECPTCLQKVTPKHVNDKMKALKDEAQDKIAWAEEKSAAVKEIEAEIEGMEELAAPVSRRVDRLHSLVDRWHREILRWEDKAADAEDDAAEATDAAKRATVEVDKLREELKSLGSELGEIGRELERVEADNARNAFWCEGFGNRGIKSFLIEAEIPKINEFALRYAERLLGPGAVVQLTATKTLKSGAESEQMDILASIPNCGQSYAEASKAQKRKMDLTLLLSMRDLLSRRAANPFQQLFADEIFDGVDKIGTECIAELIREVADVHPVCLVTHSPYLKGIADRVIEVRHDGEKAVLVTT